MPCVLNRVVGSGIRGHGPLLSLSSRVLSTTAVQHKPTATATTEQPLEPMKTIKDVPGPPHWPFLGALPHFIFNQMTGRFDGKAVHKFFIELGKQHGPIVKMQSPLNPDMVMISRPEDCEAVVRATMDNPIRDGFTSLKKIRNEAVDDYFEGKAGILAENGDEWWRVRSRIQTPMMKVKNVNTYISAMDQVTLEFLDRIASLQEEHGEMPSDFQTELYKWALESVSLVALNKRLGCLAPNLPDDSEPVRLIELVNNIFRCLNKVEIESQLWKVIPTKDFKELKTSHEDFLRLADHHIMESEAALRKDNLEEDSELTLMETLLLTKGLSRKDVVTLILDMLFAGIDTTSHTMGFTLYLLARNPDAQQRLQAEVDSVMGDQKGPLTAKHLGQLSYLKAVIKESMRLFPLVNGMARTLSTDLVLNGYLIPKGWMVFAFNMVMGWDEDHFPRAKEFLPERWLRDRPLGPIHPFAFLPFGAGTRMCVGRRIAEQEMYILLSRVMQRFTVDYQYKDMDIVSRLVSTPSEPLKFKMSERR